MAVPYCSQLPGNVESRRKVKWDTGKESLLIDFFQDNRLLWNDTDPDYFRQDMRSERLSELRQFLGVDSQGIPFREEDIKTKWKVLRGSYYRELRKQDQCKELWSDSNKQYIPRWVHFDKMCFIRNAYCTRGNISSLQRASLSVVTNAALQLSTSVPHARKRRLIGAAGHSGPDMLHHVAGKDLHSRLQLPHDANDAFGVHVALMLKSLPPRQCDLVKMDILKVFFKHKYPCNDDGEVTDGFPA
ncbi:uncharacterized protein LOC116948107 isoform X2 [Petromyzon marinus]|uniref:Uncharacterized protein LOC116948107 isoform X2 n=1 Tax=Petromyzon marinus TaxID=7757 RepID=A0AAJ7X3P3_PETMA|nr:uncharacterized protein LOC116948107 isoform X2 [Petromyzon marinus]